MSIIKVEKLEKNFGLRTVLTDITFSLERGQKTAMIGGNGTGKTTLLKIVAGLEPYDAGEITIAKDTCVGYLPQDTSFTGHEKTPILEYLKKVSGLEALEEEIKNLTDSGKSQPRLVEAQTEYEHLGGYAFTHKAEVMLAGFGLENITLDRTLNTLSSGQKSKVALTGILLKGVDLLLLDEPTNNIDLPALIWLEDFLQKSEATIIVVSHDRRFVDKVVRNIFELDWNTHTLTSTGGSYSDYLEMMQKRLFYQKQAYQEQQEEILRLTDLARTKKEDAVRGSKWKSDDSDKLLWDFKRERAARSAKAAKSIERRMEHIERIDKPVERKPFEIKLEAENKSGPVDVRLFDVVAGYSNVFKIGPMSLEIRYGNRVGVMGLNGSGKSTLLKTVTGELTPLEGKIEIGSGLRIGNMMQEHETLPRESTPLEFLMTTAKLDLEESFAKLKMFGFDDRQAKASIATLSPGGRARLLLALFSAQAVNILVLDEPTNHLDLEALEALEEVMNTFTGTILLVSHDRYFLEKAKLDTTYVLEEGILNKIPDYQDYVKKAEEKAEKLLKAL
jgi:ATP-binding cassette subfamily F protein 3